MSSLPDPGTEPRASLSSKEGSLPPPASVPAFDPLWAAALRADADASALGLGASPPRSLASAWEDVVRGRVTVLCESVGLARAHLVACLEHVPVGARRALTPVEAVAATRILSGQAQKSVAAELGLAASTISRWHLTALRVLGLPPRAVPLPLVLAAQSWAGAGHVRAARSVVFDHQGWVCLLLSIPRPRAPDGSGLTYAERDAAHLLIECCSPREIARRRSTSVHTALRQVHAVFGKLKVSGRYALIRRAVEDGWFR